MRRRIIKLSTLICVLLVVPLGTALAASNTANNPATGESAESTGKQVTSNEQFERCFMFSGPSDEKLSPESIAELKRVEKEIGKPIAVEEIKKTVCFDNDAEALDYLLANGHELPPDLEQLYRDRQEEQERSSSYSVTASYYLATIYEQTSYNQLVDGRKADYFGINPCDVQARAYSYIGSYMDELMSSGLTNEGGASCFGGFRLYENSGFGGVMDTCSADCWYVGYTINNKTSSMIVY